MSDLCTTPVEWLPTPCGKCGTIIDKPDGSCLMLEAPTYGCFYVCEKCLGSYPVSSRLGTPHPKHTNVSQTISPPELAFHEIGAALRETTKSIQEQLGVEINRGMVSKEADPTGRKPNEPGAKLDAGKPRVALVLGGFARALKAVAEVGTFGANKYTPNGWMQVPNGIERYEDAHGRHTLDMWAGEECAADSGLMHLAHRCWNDLAVLELELRKKEEACPTQK